MNVLGLTQKAQKAQNYNYLHTKHNSLRLYENDNVDVDCRRGECFASHRKHGKRRIIVTYKINNAIWIQIRRICK